MLPVPERIPEDTTYIISSDANLIKRIRDTLGVVAAVQVTRWLTNQSLQSCMDFVRSL